MDAWKSEQVKTEDQLFGHEHDNCQQGLVRSEHHASLGTYLEHIVTHYFLSPALPPQQWAPCLGASELPYASLSELDSGLGKKCSLVLLFCANLFKSFVPHDPLRCIHRQLVAPRVLVFSAAALAIVLRAEFCIRLSRHTLFQLSQQQRKQQSAVMVPGSHLDRQHFARLLVDASGQICTELKRMDHPYHVFLSRASLVETLEGAILSNQFHPAMKACGAVFAAFVHHCCSDVAVGATGLLKLLDEREEERAVSEWYLTSFLAAVKYFAQAAESALLSESSEDGSTGNWVIMFTATRCDFCVAVLTAATREVCRIWVQQHLSQYCPLCAAVAVGDMHAPDLKVLIRTLSAALGCMLVDQLYLHLQTCVWNKEITVHHTRTRQATSAGSHPMEGSKSDGGAGGGGENPASYDETGGVQLKSASLLVALDSIGRSRVKNSRSCAIAQACLLALQFQSHLIEEPCSAPPAVGSEAANAELTPHVVTSDATAAGGGGAEDEKSCDCIDVARLPPLSAGECDEYIRQDSGAVYLQLVAATSKPKII